MMGHREWVIGRPTTYEATPITYHPAPITSEKRGAVPQRRAVVVELDVRLGLERDGEVERERAIRRLREAEVRAPVVNVALQRDDVTRELVALEIVRGAPPCRPLRRETEVQVAVHRGRRRNVVLRSADCRRADRQLVRRLRA